MPYKPSQLAIDTTKGKDISARPRTTDIDLPAQGLADPRLKERPVGEYDRNRAKRVLNRPVISRRRG